MLSEDNFFITSVTGLMKNMQPVPGSNRGPSAYRANALPTELTGLPTHNSPVPVHQRYRARADNPSLGLTVGLTEPLNA